MPARKTGLEPRSPGSVSMTPGPGLVLAIIALVVFFGIATTAHCDDWRIEARGIVLGQTTLSGGSSEDRNKFRPGVRVEVEAPLVLGHASPKAPLAVAVRLALLDQPDASSLVNAPAGPVNQASGARPAATFAIAVEYAIGRAALSATSTDPSTGAGKQQVATRIGVEVGYSSFLAEAEEQTSRSAGSWVVGVVRLTEDRDGFEVRGGAGIGQIGRAGEWGRVGVVGVTIPIRKSGGWLVVGGDAVLSKVSTVTVWTGVRLK